jgi:VanZ family protein
MAGKNNRLSATMVRWGPAIIVMMFIFAASSIPGSQLPHLAVWDVSAKKMSHMLGYALLAAAYMYALRKGERIERSCFIIAFCMACIYAASDEWHQKFVPGRSSSFRDVCIDAGGTLIGLTSWYWICRRTGSPDKSADS